MVYGDLELRLKNGDEHTASWPARAHVKRFPGAAFDKFKFDNYTVWDDNR
jgi:hypothetical protein